MEKMTMEVITPPKRGRPRVNMPWPTGNFTFKNLSESKAQHGLCDSSLRNKIREGVQSGEIKKVEILNGKTGRPQNVYSKKPLEVNIVSPDAGVAGFTNVCNTQVQQQDSVGESTHLS